MYRLVRKVPTEMLTNGQISEILVESDIKNLIFQKSCFNKMKQLFFVNIDRNEQKNNLIVYSDKTTKNKLLYET